MPNASNASLLSPQRPGNLGQTMDAQRPIPQFLVRSSYQPSQEETEGPMEIDASPEELARVVVQPVDITWKNRPE